MNNAQHMIRRGLEICREHDLDIKPRAIGWADHVTAPVEERGCHGMGGREGMKSGTAAPSAVDQKAWAGMGAVHVLALALGGHVFQ